MTREFKLPDLGEGITEAQVIRLLIKQGERITEDQNLVEVETDKAAVEIPSPYAGIATIIHVEEGQTINVGDVLVTFDEADGSAAPAVEVKSASPKASTVERPVAVPSAEVVSRETPAPASSSTQRRKTRAAAAPAVRRLAREMGIDIDSLVGTGPGGRITRDDLHAHAAAETPPVAAAPSSAQTSAVGAPQRVALPPGIDDTDKWGSLRRVPLSQIRKTIASRMSLSAFTAVHVTHGDDVDVTELDRMRRTINEATGGEPRLTVMTFLIRAVATMLRQYPIFNSSLDEEKGQIVYKDYIHMGIAVDSQRGLVVPVIRNADRLSIREIANQLRSIAHSIRANQFSIEDLRGGTFTITNVGALGGTFSTPIINFPEVAILGLARSRLVPVVREGKLEEKLVLPLSLSFDHRVTDGANAARFTTSIKEYLETPSRFVLD
ncbi:MAG: 2-oxo acid dehydrogenase subunit E2 [Planctomycetes bacterium]|nr:2-oxo acid dehydrogenase subunit E2 [Planctomycetota bacterium]